MGRKRSIYPKRLRQTYTNMNHRCYNSNDKRYKYYGRKGIVVCDEWIKDKNTFYNWALSNGYTSELTIDRKDSNGNYEPDNCRWITLKEQANNRTNNIFIEHDGEIKTVYQWSQETGISPGAVKNRFKKGKDILEDYYHIEININGEIKTLIELSKESDISYDTLLQRYRAGCKPEDLLNPVIEDTKHIKINGEIHTVTEWAMISGLTRNIILNRISYGWKNEDLLKPKMKNGKKKYIKINGESHTADEWCKIYDICLMTFYRRMKNGYEWKELIS